jgi:hypothetical protein
VPCVSVYLLKPGCDMAGGDSYPIFLSNAYSLYDGTRTVTMYGSVSDFPEPAKYAPFVHRWVREHIQSPESADWGVRIMSHRVALITREHYVSTIYFAHAEQKFHFSSDFDENAMDGPMEFPDIQNFDWSCLLREAL